MHRPFLRSYVDGFDAERNARELTYLDKWKRILMIQCVIVSFVLRDFSTLFLREMWWAVE